MPRFFILGIAILLLLLPLFSPCSAMAFTVQGETTVIQQGAPSKAPAKAAPATTSSHSQAKASSQTSAKASSQSQPSVHRKVVNVVVDRIEEGAVYSRDGQKFQITSDTKVIDNSNPVTKMRTAELAFENGDLVTVTLK